MGHQVGAEESTPAEFLRGDNETSAEIPANPRKDRFTLKPADKPEGG